jgi:hypothetical protein
VPGADQGFESSFLIESPTASRFSDKAAKKGVCGNAIENVG